MAKLNQVVGITNKCSKEFKLHFSNKICYLFTPFEIKFVFYKKTRFMFSHIKHLPYLSHIKGIEKRIPFETSFSWLNGFISKKAKCLKESSLFHFFPTSKVLFYELLQTKFEFCSNYQYECWILRNTI